LSSSSASQSSAEKPRSAGRSTAARATQPTSRECTQSLRRCVTSPTWLHFDVLWAMGPQGLTRCSAHQLEFSKYVVKLKNEFRQNANTHAMCSRLSLEPKWFRWYAYSCTTIHEDRGFSQEPSPRPVTDRPRLRVSKEKKRILKRRPFTEAVTKKSAYKYAR
jgi:hypothetical protein